MATAAAAVSTPHARSTSAAVMRPIATDVARNVVCASVCLLYVGHSGVMNRWRFCFLFKFWEISDNISETVQDIDTVAMKCNGKSYVAYRMAPLLTPLNDFKGHFCRLKLFQLHALSNSTNLLT